MNLKTIQILLKSQFEEGGGNSPKSVLYKRVSIKHKRLSKRPSRIFQKLYLKHTVIVSTQ